MDKGQSRNRWGWLPLEMPGVTRLMKDKRAKYGDAWVSECWRRGVLAAEPGWFFAGEGGLMVGTLFDDPELMAFAQARVTRTQAVLILREPEATSGAH
jgi:hypothetical protein